MFMIIFIFEAWVKIIALGFVLSKNSYLRDSWNCLDFTVVVISIAATMPGVSNYTFLRTLRLFRPLRNFRSLPNMKSLVGTIISSLAGLGEILLFSMIFFYIFAILGLSLWAGEIHYRCRLTEEPVDGDWQVVPDDTRVWGNRDCPVGYWGSLVEQYDNHPDTLDMDIIGSVYRDTKIEELQYGIVNFDNLLRAMLTVFQCLTLEGWVKIMYNYEDSTGAIMATFYFVALILM